MKKILIMILLVMFGALSVLTSVSTKQVSAAGLSNEERANNGISIPNSTVTYETKTALAAMPKTFEAYMNIPKSITSRPGILFGNYGPTNKTAAFSFEVQWNKDKSIAFPKLYYDVDNVGDINPSVVNIEFKEVDVRSDDFIHLVITHDTTYYTKSDSTKYTLAKCYINGVLKQTLEVPVTTNIETYYNGYNYVPSSNVRVGGDFRSDNAQYFKGKIKGMEFYTDVRTDTEIASDATRKFGATSGDNLLASYDFTKSAIAYLNDLSGNGYGLTYTNPEDVHSSLDALVFNAEETYLTKKKLGLEPYTFEAEIFLDKSLTGRAGVIFGNYGAGACINFEISSNGKPRFYYKNVSGVEVDVTFLADVRTSDWVHLAITHNIDEGFLNCYINGELVDTSFNSSEYDPGVTNTTYVLGGDHRSGNAQYFKGAIRSLTVFSSAKTEEEIYTDYSDGVNVSDNDVILSYNLGSNDLGKDIKDESNNGFDLLYESAATNWFNNKTAITDYAYSFAVVGDTQILAEKYTYAFAGIYTWLLNNQQSKKIAHVFGLGDITNGNTAVEWNVAKTSISRLDGVLSYSLVRGNHDGTVLFNSTFNNSNYTDQFDGFYEEGKAESSYKLLTVADIDYLLITLDYGASDDELLWASELCETYPNHRVIITTHAYLFRDGTTLGSNDVCPASASTDRQRLVRDYNTGDEIWDEFISQHGNIFLVMSGHDPCDNVVTTQREGIHGNVVTEMLIDPQGMDAAIGATAMVCMLYFSEDGKTIDVEYYSTSKNQYFKKSNQYTIELPTTEVDEHYFTIDKFDDTYHWSECKCGGIVYGGKTKHTWDNGVLINDPNSLDNGKMLFSCICGATKVEAQAITKPKVGCGGSIASSIFGLTGLISALFIFKKRKND